MWADSFTTLPSLCMLPLFSFLLFTAIGDPGIVAEAITANDQIDETPQADFPSVSAREASISERSGLWGFSFKVPFLCHLGHNKCELKQKCPENRRSWIFGCGSGNVCCKPEPAIEDLHVSLSEKPAPLTGPPNETFQNPDDIRAEVRESSRGAEDTIADDCEENGGECSGNCTDSLENSHWKCEEGRKCCVSLD
uniref:Carboxypeptidase inhibitor n=1 Tax=Rhipicephalus zambeziensis TaxID=60191 RepID=A0A224Y8G6_9ACAR